MGNNIEQHDLDQLFGISQKDRKVLILFNDDFNEFDFVIEALMEVCRHTTEQASQCALVAHTRGKCDVKTGDLEQLKEMKDALISRGLNVIIQ